MAELVPTPGVSRSRRPNAATPAAINPDGAQSLISPCGWSATQLSLPPWPPGTQRAPDLMAYLRTIARAQRSYVGDGWVTYDASFRRQAAASKFLDWSQIDQNLYAEAFAGRAKTTVRCHHCLSEFHRPEQCQYAPDPPRPPQNLTPHTSGQPREVCRLYNDPRGN